MTQQRIAMIGIFVALPALVLLGVIVGPDGFEPRLSIDALLDYFGCSDTAVPSALSIAVGALRLPRILLAMLIGASLGLAGAVTQGTFRNVLAEPGVLGISVGAALAAVLAIVFGLDQSLWATPLFAAVGAGAVMFVLHRFARNNTLNLLLVGLAIGTFCAACITLVLALYIERWEVGIKVITWMMGSFEARSWQHVAWALPPTCIGIALAFYLRRDLDLLHLGHETASSLGVELERTRLLSLLCIAILVGTATALVGVIAFVGLMVPHVARSLFGSRHSSVLGFSMLLGAILLGTVDVLTRHISDVVIPPGVVTSLLGAPFFILLLSKKDRSVL